MATIEDRTDWRSFSIRVPAGAYEALKARARREHRSLSAQAQMYIEHGLSAPEEEEQ